MPGSISTWTKREKVAEAIRRSKSYLPGALGYQIDALLSPTNLEIMTGTLVGWAAAHLFGVGEVVDVALLLVGAVTIGFSIGQVLTDLFTFAQYSIGATSDADLDRAARAFASAVVTGGITAVMAILLHRSAVELQGARGAAIADVARPARPGLVEVGADPRPTEVWAKPPVVGDPLEPAGSGVTNPFGDVTYSTAGTATQQQLVRIHELVHRFLVPRARPLRTFRVRLSMSGYVRSALLKYCEEALAETVAQLRVNGLQGLWEGFTFPTSGGYFKFTVPLKTALGQEGAAIGTIMVGTVHLVVTFVPGVPPPAHPGPASHRGQQRRR